LPPPLRYDLVRAMYRKAAIRPYRVDDEPLLFGLAVKVLGQFRQAVAVEVGGDGDVLERRAKLAADLLGKRGVHLVTD